MPGTVVRDANATDLLEDITLTEGNDGAGTVGEYLWPGDVQFELDITAAGTSPTIDVAIEGASNSAFDEDVVLLDYFSIADGDAEVFQSTTYVDKRYVRASTTVGSSNTDGDYTGTTLKAVLPHDRRVRATTTAGDTT